MKVEVKGRRDDEDEHLSLSLDTWDVQALSYASYVYRLLPTTSYDPVNRSSEINYRLTLRYDNLDVAPYRKRYAYV